jgi:putative ABC transport system permease protein
VSGLLLLTWRQISYHRGRSIILVLALAVTIFLPLATRMLVSRYDTELRSRAAASPLVAGAKGNRFDLTLATLYFRDAELDVVPYSEYEKIRDAGFGVAIPLNLRFTARERPIVATSPEYFEARQLSAGAGRLPFRLGEVVLGAQVAEDLELGPDDALFSDQREIYDISKPPALKMRVSGVLRATGGPDDSAVFVDIRTAWVLEGIMHGHQESAGIDSELVMEEGEGHRKISPAMIEYNEITPANAASFHYHGGSEGLPLSSILVLPRDAKSRTLLKARVNASKLYQMVVPARVIDDLMAFVFRIQAFLDLIAVILGITTLLLIVLVVLLTMRMRAREIEALHRIGGGRFTVVTLYALEIGILVVLAGVLAGAALSAALAWLPNLVRAL